MAEAARAQATDSTPQFVGRRLELKILTDRLRRLSQGHRSTVIIEGEPGIGTSRLVNEALRQAGHGLRVLRFSGPRHCFTRFLSQHCTTGRCGAVPVAGYLTRLAGKAPLVLVLEDLDRTDPASWRLIHPVAEQLADHAILLVVTSRPAPRPAELDQLVSDLITEGATHLRLRGLDRAETALLAAAVAGTNPGAAAAVLSRTGGNPQLVIDVVSTLMADGVLGGRPKTPPHLPASLRALILGRLAGLPRSLVDLLRIATVLGPRFTVTHLARFIGQSSVRLVPMLEDAVRAGVLEQVGPHLTIQPELLGDALYEDVPPAIRSALHVEAVWVLDEAGAPAPALADQLVKAAATGDPAVLRRLRRAAQDLLSSSPQAAADLLQQALDRTLTAAGPELRNELLSDLAAAQLWSGYPAQAERTVRAVLERPPDPAVGATARLALVEVVRQQGRYREAAGEAAALLAGKDVPAEVRARLRAEYAQALLLDGDPAGAGDAATTALREADQLTDPRAAAVAQAALAGVALSAGHVDHAVELAVDAVQRSHPQHLTTAGDAHSVVSHRHILATALMVADRRDAAEEAVADGLRAAERLGNALTAPSYQLLRAVLRFRSGRWDEAVADADAGLNAARAAGAVLWVAPARGVLAMIAVHRNEIATAGDLLVAGTTVPAPGAHWLQWAHGLHEEACGRIEAAAAALRAAWAGCTATDYPLLGPDLVRLLLAVDDRAAADQAVAQLEAVAARIGTPTARGSILRCRGLRDDDPWLLGQAAQLLAGAGQHDPLVAAQVSEEAAVAGAPEQPGRTATLLEAARSGFRLLGARRDLARVDARLREIGVHSGRSRPRSRGGGWDSLTTAEREVVALTTEGLTNREIAARLFISPRTVEAHLTHVFAKLDLPGRPALRVAAARRNAAHGLAAVR